MHGGVIDDQSISMAREKISGGVAATARIYSEIDGVSVKAYQRRAA